MLATNKGSLVAVAIILLALAGIAFAAPKLIGTDLITGAHTATGCVHNAQATPNTATTVYSSAANPPNAGYGVSVKNLANSGCHAGPVNFGYGILEGTCPAGWACSPSYGASGWADTFIADQQTSAFPTVFADPPSSAADGTYTFKFSVQDVEDIPPAARVDVTLTYVIDRVAPIASVTSPTAFSTVSGTVTITATASDGLSGVSKVEFFVDGSKIGEDTTSPYSVNWNTASWAPGPHDIDAQAIDRAGNRGFSPLVQDVFIQDTAAPSLTVTHSPANPVVNQQVTYTATANDGNGLGTREIKIFVDDLTNAKQTCTSSTNINTCQFSETYTSTGTHNYYATAKDGANNQARDPASGTKSVTVSPSVTLIVDKKGSGASLGTVTSSPPGISCGATCTASFASGTQVTLSAPSGAGFSFTGWSGGGCSGTGNCVITITADTTVTANFIESSPPVISNVQSTGMTSASATITWTTNEDSDSRVYYGTTSGVFTAEKTSSASVQTHSITLTGLTANQQYFYKVGSCDSGNNCANSTQNTFTTQPQPPSCDPKPPVLTLEPASASTNVGVAQTYTVKLSNNDEGPCAPVTWTLSKTGSCNGQVTCTLGQSTFVSGPGAENTTTLTVNSNAGNTYTVGVSATDGTRTASDTSTATFSVLQCTGSVLLNIPSTVTRNLPATAEITGLTNCNGKQIYLRQNNCQGQNVAAPVASGSSGANITFTAPSTPASYTYAACIDKDGNNDYTGAGEFATKTFTVVSCVKAQPILYVTPETLDAGAGETAMYSVKVQNNFQCAYEYELSSTCQTGWNCTFANKKLLVPRGENGTTTFSVKSPTSANVNDDVTFTVTARDTADTQYSDSKTVHYIVAVCIRSEKPDVSSAPAAGGAPAGQTYDYKLTIDNPDTCSATFGLSTTCPSGWNCTLNPKNVSILSDESGSVELEVKSTATAGATNYTINVTVTNQQNSTNKASLIIKHTIPKCTDSDSDGFFAEGGFCGAKDCSDNDTLINPDAAEVCGDGVDNTCNGVIDGAAEGCDPSILGQTFGKYKTNDGICDSKLGETKANSPADCKSSAQDAFCGNNDAESGEQCDGTDDVSCPKLCSTTCSCPFLIGDGFCNEAAGETEAISVDCRAAVGFGAGAAIAVVLLVIGGGAGYYFLRRRGLFNLSLAHGTHEVSSGRDLEPAIDTMMSQGYSPDEITSHLTSTGWSQTDIKSGMNAAHDDQVQLGALAEQFEVDTPSYELKKAERYIKSCMSKGFTPTEIRTALKETGWPEHRIDEIINKFTEKHVKTHASKAAGEPSEDLSKLKKYVKKELEEGHTPQQIKKALKDSGWSSSAIDEVLP